MKWIEWEWNTIECNGSVISLFILFSSFPSLFFIQLNYKEMHEFNWIKHKEEWNEMEWREKRSMLSLRFIIFVSPSFHSITFTFIPKEMSGTNDSGLEQLRMKITQKEGGKEEWYYRRLVGEGITLISGRVKVKDKDNQV